MRYSSGKIAHTVCDICARTFKYKRRKKMWDGNITCPECWNKKEESLDPQKYMPRHGDAEALRDGRPADYDEVEDGSAQAYLDSVAERP